MMNNMMEQMMGKMMETMMPKMMEMMMTSMMNSMMGAMGAPQVAEAAVEAPAKQEVRKVSLEELLADASAVEFGCWKAINRDGEEYTWCGWCNQNNGEADFPGHQLYRVNDFYLKKLGIKHSCYKASNGEMKFSPKYNIRTGNAKALIAHYQIRSKVAQKDKDEFLKYIEQYEKAKKAMNDSWIE